MHLSRSSRKLVLFTAILLAFSTFSAAQGARRRAAPAAQTGAANVYLMQEGFVDANGVMIYFKSIGRGQPLVIVHGGPGASHDYFLPNLYLLARHNRVVFIDERGSGRSPQLDDPRQYTIENMVDDLESVRQALGLGKISLLGHSFGGVLAQAYALKYQRNLSHLILASTFASTSHINEVLARMKAAMSPDARQRTDELERAGLFGKGRPWEHGRYPDAYADLAWGDGYFP
ncbi:MAG: alpha/beta fold hydrolase, partial [Acidobacteria bacterium]|nr:alpha/beta fold hydrolase [Acidobacteriota bacterium]